MRIRVFTACVLYFACLISACLLCAAQQTPALETHVDHVVVLKKERILQLISQGKVIRSYKIALGGDPVGAKNKQGDHKTPEGDYVLDWRNPHGKFYKSIHISYPNAQDRASANKRGVSPGGDVFIHGLANGFAWIGSSHRLKDWTDGCIAVTNQEMDQIWHAVADGTPIAIRP
jgi:murein L,D-transpeptidase YafK